MMQRSQYEQVHFFTQDAWDDSADVIEALKDNESVTVGNGLVSSGDIIFIDDIGD